MILLKNRCLLLIFVINYLLTTMTPLMFWFTQFVARYTRKGFRELQKHLGQLNGVMEESISGQKVVRAFRRNESVVEAFRQRNQEVYQAGVYANTYALLLMPLTNVLGNFFVIVLAGLGGWLALQGLVSVGIIATFINYGQNFVQPLRQLANLYNSIQAALAGAERVFETIDFGYKFSHLAAVWGRPARVPWRRLQVGSDSINDRPYRLVMIRRSKIATTPWSSWVRIKRPNPWRKRRMASGREYWEKGSSKVSERAATIGSDGTSKGSLTITNTESACPGTSTPSQKARVPSSTARSELRKVSSRVLAEAPSPCS